MNLWSSCKAVIKYTATIVFQPIEQFLALRKATSDIQEKPSLNKLAKKALVIVCEDVIPIWIANFIVNYLQSYYIQDRESADEALTLNPWVFYLTLMSFGLKLYSYSYGGQTTIRIAYMDTAGPAIINANKDLIQESSCKECGTVKGGIREYLLFNINEATAYGFSFIPYVGPYLSLIDRVYTYGAYISSAATPNRCERHKGFLQESVIAFGLSYELNIKLLEYLLEATVGFPPFLQYRALTHLLLLAHIYLATYIKIPMVEHKDATFYVDIFYIYNRIWRFILDVAIDGLASRIPKDFARDKDAPPLIPLSTATHWATRILDADKETEEPTLAPTPCQLVLYDIKDEILPPSLRNMNQLIKDPILSLDKKFKDHERVLQSIESTLRNTKTGNLLSLVSKPVEQTLKLLFNIPKKVTRTILELSQEQDVWDFIVALRLWLSRHGIISNVSLNEIKNPTEATLHKGMNIEIQPRNVVPTSIAPSEIINTDSKKMATPIGIPDLKPVEKPNQTVVIPATFFINPNKNPKTSDEKVTPRNFK